MSPSFAGLNSADGVGQHAIVRRDVFLQSCVGPYGRNLFFSELGRSTPFPAVASAVFSAVSLVRCCGVPTQIGNVIIKRIAVIVAALQPLRSGANESCQNKSVRLKNFNFVVTPKADKRAVKFLVCGKFFNLASFQSAQSAMVRNLVKVFIPDNWQPAFHTAQYGINWGVL